MRRRTIAALLVGFLVAGLASLVDARPAAAAGGMQIQTVYAAEGLGDEDDSPALDPCEADMPACDDGIDPTPKLELLMAAAASSWASMIRDDHSMKIHFWWTSDPDPTALVLETDDAGRATEARIVIPVKHSYYYDATPLDDEEFAMEPRLFGDTHPTDQTEAYHGSPPEVLEVGYAGKGPGLDLLSIILHEMGHVMGLNRWTLKKTQACTKGDPTYHVDPALVAGADMSIDAFRSYGNSDDPQDNIALYSYKDDCEHLAAGGIKACKSIADEAAKYDCLSHQALLYPGALPGSRSRPSAVDVLAVATAAGWKEVHLPRRFAAKTGSWNQGSTWIGGRVPTAQNDVYLLKQDATVTVTQLALAADVHIGTKSGLVVASTLDATSLDVDAGASATVDGGVIDVWSLANHGFVQGRGTVKPALLDNDGTIRAIGGTLAFLAAYPNNPTLDLGTSWDEPAKVHALAGDLVFHGKAKEVAADVRIGSGRSLTFTHGWTQSMSDAPEHGLHFEGGEGVATLGGVAELRSTVEVDGDARLASPVTFRPSVRVEVPQPDDRLVLDSDTTFHGGSYLGAGQIVQRGNAKTLGQQTTIGPVGIYDWDGYGGSATTVPQSATLHIKATTIEADPGDGFDGHVAVAANGRVVVETASVWRLDGSIALDGAILAGMPVTIAGDVTATGSARIENRIDLPEAGALHAPNAGDVLTLTALGSKLLHGTIDGAGRLDIAPGAGVSGNGVIGTRAVNSGVLAPGESLAGPGDQPGRVAFARDFAQSSAGSLDFSLHGTGLGQFDEVAIRGTARLSGTLVVRAMPGYVPAPGDQFLVMSWDSSIGGFENVVATGLPDGWTVAAEYLPGGLRVTVND